MDRTIGKFELLRPLGHGAMGEVFLARDPSIGREVAIKTILPSLVPLDDVRERFAREAQAAGLLQHPNVATVFEYGEDSDVFYLVMEYVPGEDLGAMLQGEELSTPEILEVIAQVCEGLHHAHKQGIVHRDIKPSNIMVVRDDEGLRAKVMDFGVARTAHSDLTQTGQIVGTLAYMAPEYLRTGKASAQSDQFSAGVLLYEALSGEKPFRGETTGAVVYGIIHDTPRPLDAAHLKGVSPAVRTLVMRALCKEPGERFALTGDLAKALRSAKDPLWSSTGDATEVLDRPQPGTTERVQMESHSGRKWPWLLGLAAVAIGSALLFAWLRKPAAPPAIQTPTAANVHLNDVVLDEAERLVDTKPKEALALIQGVIDATPKDVPMDPDAYALKLVALRNQGNLEGFGETLSEARYRGVTPKDLLTNKAYKAMLERDKSKKKLSEELRGRLIKGE